ncbi:MAG TPA: hypothetical protein VJT67_07380 [Longimicrobiaceae bacterium]|nr:hypothetical protein [Longimicrobiaceae bacterium]
MTRTFSAAFLLVALAACSRRPSYGALAGDGYVALATGEQTSIDSRTVRLLPDAGSIDTAMAESVCYPRQKVLDGLGEDSAALDSAKAVSERAWAGRAALLTRRSLRIPVAAAADGKFAVDSIGAGRYRVWADATVNGERWSWLVPVEVKGGDTARVTLSNDNADEDPFRCQRRDLLREMAKQEREAAARTR